MSTFVIISEKEHLDSLERAIRAGAVGVRVVRGSRVSEVDTELASEDLRCVFTAVEHLEEALAAIPGRRVKVFGITVQVEEEPLVLTLADTRIGGLVAMENGLTRSWEVTYLARRLSAPKEPSPHMGQLLSWGATTISWQPRTTREQRQIVERIEGMCVRLGVDRRQASSVSTAAHELLMNAMYDAPVDSQDRPKYALDRAADLVLLDEEIPTLRFTLSGDFLALDVTDPNGRLPRNRFVEGVLRGHRNMMGRTADLDTTHGGAGLGLHTLYSSGNILRAEVVPMQLTHVSWVLDRRVARKDLRKSARSLYYLPQLPNR